MMLGRFGLCKPSEEFHPPGHSSSITGIVNSVGYSLLNITLLVEHLIQKGLYYQAEQDRVVAGNLLKYQLKMPLRLSEGHRVS
jgi:hypothetical protein